MTTMTCSRMALWSGRIFCFDAVGPQGRPWMWVRMREGEVRLWAFAPGIPPVHEYVRETHRVVATVSVEPVERGRVPLYKPVHQPLDYVIGRDDMR
jgi:hypothetical protein